MWQEPPSLAQGRQGGWQDKNVQTVFVRGNQPGDPPGFIRIYRAKTAANARRFLRELERACPICIRTILTDNGREFTDRSFGLRKRSPTGKHDFGQLCAELGIELRLAPPPERVNDFETVGF